MANARGPGRARYQKKYNARPEELERRRELARERYHHEKKNGKLPEGVDLHHKTPKRAGGGEGDNLTPTPASKHRGWNKGKKMK